jgi:predicted hydrocarbon binding protein
MPDRKYRFSWKLIGDLALGRPNLGPLTYRNFLGQINDFSEFVKSLQSTLKDMMVGILRVEKADLAQGSLILTVSEDLDCSGLPELHYEICTYDEGFIAGLLECFTGHQFKVKEIDCWCTGDRTCRFTADLIK